MADVLVIGGGHNGLAAAFDLARAGWRPVVFEQRAEVGGGAVTGTLHPGFRCPTLSHEASLHPAIAADMALHRHGLEVERVRELVCAIAPDGPPIVIHSDTARTADGLRRVSAADAAAYPAFRAAVDGVAGALGTLLTVAPPDLDAPSARDLWDLLRAGRRLRALGRRDGARLFRWAPMPVADFTDEWFETDRLRAAVAARGLSATMLGPRSAGSTLVLLWRDALPPRGEGVGAARGGPGALTAAMAAAAAAAGAQIRTDARVERILVDDGRVTGVLAGGREWTAPRVLSAIDPKSTLLRLVDPLVLPPAFHWGMRHYRASGTLAKVNLALARLPAFRGVVDPGALGGRVHVGPGLDHLERAFDDAKYGAVSREPWLEIRFPSLTDPSLAPPGAHVASIYVHYVPYALRQGTWNEAAREALLESVLRTLETYAPDIRALVVAAQAITPADLERDHGYWGGHVFHGELAMDQLFAMRPLLGHARYRTPVEGLWLCGAGTHPGGVMSGVSGRLAAEALLQAARA